MGAVLCACDKENNNGNAIIVKGDISLVDNQPINNNNHSKNPGQNNGLKKNHESETNSNKNEENERENNNDNIIITMKTRKKKKMKKMKKMKKIHF